MVDGRDAKQQNQRARFLPTSRADMSCRNWDTLDVLFVTGDAYIDHPAFGTALLARLLEAHGFRVGILAQPNWRSLDDMRRLGRPRLFAAISAGAMDSMVNHYTAAKKVRNDDAYTPGGRPGARPNRATIAYTAAIKGAFKGVPTVIGGIEASLRRLAHYDYWDDAVRRSILADSKADLLVYGMAEDALLELARRMANGDTITKVRDLRGTAFLAKSCPPGAVELPSFEDVSRHGTDFNKAFRLASDETNPHHGRTLAQKHGTRWLVVNPPSFPLTEESLDRLYALPFTKQPHPDYTEAIPAYTQIKFSITSHRGCFGGCAFCAITHHQGKIVQSRSKDSIKAEVDQLSRHPEFRGTVTDVGGPTANMYGLFCNNASAQANCRRTSCLYPQPCPQLDMSDHRLVELLSALQKHPAVKHLFVASGLRFDLLKHQPDYFARLLKHHVGGRLKIAPESVRSRVTDVMRKPGPKAFAEFLARFRQQSQALDKKHVIVPYFISGHPGSTLNDMIEVALFLKQHNLRVEQVQEFTPTPGSLATCIYHTGSDPLTGETVHVPRSAKDRRLQKALLLWHIPEQWPDVLEALRLCGREDAARRLRPDRPRSMRRANSSRPG
ncbi:MAG: YgiQ family radical SAM protein [Deltaproteobacteria bacterium]|jgi:uncharacterized radical SAM protein YgiQ|nr:YgiQ family radical SAM protein [Deltaproteobacteria bacterium]